MEKKENTVEDAENKETLQDENQTVDKEENKTTEENVENESSEEKEQTEEEVKKEEAKTNKKKSVETLEKELGEMKDKYLRIFAEFDNYRKRTTKEKQNIIKLAAKDCISSLLPVVDDFKRAIKVAEENDNEDNIPQGIIHIYGKLIKSLEQQGLRVMKSTGEPFDAELHEAMTKIPAPSEDMKGKVIDTIEYGYYLNDAIIRYAKVVVGE